ncbi:hypothetical protein DQ04_12461010 [Trypanosoma grayi]|uniref:hypothetical protein n=1 Tax=Trypanosoma grayi TaxID=71804 RepID=UPI0004F45660|nr:hypothetical protein DQ04_12461010 [Trypanosoma grayi]KEG06746.1 hypothetical protein DQ04_12461010 [Trypanosoma grayi]
MLPPCWGGGLAPEPSASQCAQRTLCTAPLRPRAHRHVAAVPAPPVTAELRSASHPQAQGSAVMPHNKSHVTATIRLRSCMSAAQTRAGAGACRHTTPPPCGYG